MHVTGWGPEGTRFERSILFEILDSFSSDSWIQHYVAAALPYPLGPKVWASDREV